MDKILLDSDVIINILKKKEETLKQLMQFQESELYISPITVAEIFAGAKESEIDTINRLFSYFKVAEINYGIGEIAGVYAKKYKKAFCGISLEDYLIAATAKYHHLTLWSYNKKHYPMDDILTTKN
jgi:predicted nucleic acid-binding protein